MKNTNKLLISLAFSGLMLILIPSTSLAATYTVTKTADTNDGTCDADCSLREAIVAANNNAGNDTIEFNIPEGDGGYIAASGDTQAYWKITINSPLTITDDGTYINGYTQTGASRNTASFGNTLNTVLTIQVYFNDDTYQLQMDFITSSNNHITGLNLIKKRSNSSSVMKINGGDSNWLEGNFFGSDITGKSSVASGMIRFDNAANSNIIGTNGDGSGDIGEKNLFGGTGASLAEGLIQWYPNSGGSDNNIVSGNYIGTDVTGNACTQDPLARNVIAVYGGSGNRIGTNYDGVSDSEESNVIGCVNDLYGTHRAIIRLITTNSIVQGNYIGISPNGTKLGTLIGSTERGAIEISNYSGNYIKGNTISATADYGIVVVDSYTTTNSQNTFRENVIYGSNVKDIAFYKTTSQIENDPGDSDTGPNNLMNYPVIEHAEYLGAGRFWIHGILDGNPSEAPYTIEVCRSSDHSTAHGGCLESLGVISISSPGAWDMYVNVDSGSDSNLLSFTSLATNSGGSTSEFSKNIGGRMPLIGPSIARSSSDYISSAPLPTTIVSSNSVTSLVGDNVFKWDAYLDISQEATLPVQKIAGYWQATPVWEVWWKSTFNNAKILQQEVINPFTLVFNYNPNSIDPNLSTKNLKVAFSEDKENWKIIPGSIQDIIRNNIAIVTKNGGYFTLVAGY